MRAHDAGPDTLFFVISCPNCRGSVRETNYVTFKTYECEARYCGWVLDRENPTYIEDRNRRMERDDE